MGLQNGEHVISTKWGLQNGVSFNLVTTTNTNISLQIVSMVMYVAPHGLYKMGAGNFHDQLLPSQPPLQNDIEF